MARATAAPRVAFLLTLLIGLHGSSRAQALQHDIPSNQESASPLPSLPASKPNEPAATTKPGNQNPKEAGGRSDSVTPWGVLNSAISDRNPARRAEAVAALGTIPFSFRATHLLQGLLEDKDSSIRALIAKAFGEMRGKTAIAALKKLLSDESPDVRFAAATELWNAGDRSGREVLIQTLAGDRTSSAGLLKNELQSAKKELQDPGKLAIYGAKEAATTVFGPAGWGIKIMEEVTQDRSAYMRAMSAILLGPDPSLDGLHQLEDALFDKSWVVRAAAAQALGITRHREEITHLNLLLRDSKPAVRCMAAAAIIRLSDPDARPPGASVAKSAPEARPVFGAPAPYQSRKETP